MTTSRLHSLDIRLLRAFAVVAEENNISRAAQRLFISQPPLTRHIRHALQDKAQISLSDLIGAQPLQHGLAELVAYLQLGSDAFNAVVDENSPEPIQWQAHTANGEPVTRTAHLPRVIFVR